MCVFLVILLVMSSGCMQTLENINSKLKYPKTKPDTNTTKATVESYTIGVHNNQRIGMNKVNNPEFMRIVTQVYDKYDIVAIQEIVDISSGTPRILDDALKEHIYTISERVGRTSYKEQYAYYYKPATVQLVRSEIYPDIHDLFERDPFVAIFKLRDGVDFIIIQCHVKPDDAEREIEMLQEVIRYYRQRYPDEPDIILLGDFNADCAYYNDTGQHIKDFQWLVASIYDTTVGASNCAYDRILVSQSLKDNIVGVAVVDRFDTQFGLTNEQAKSISDHYPVYIKLNRENN